MPIINKLNCHDLLTIVSSHPYKYLNYSLLEAALKAKFGKITGYFDHINRDGSWWYRAKDNGTLKVVDLEIACDAAGINPADVMSELLIDDGSKLEDAAIASRINQMINATTGNSLDFALKTGIQHSELKHIITKSGRLTMSGLKRIIVNFPATNVKWLLHGNGEMFLEQESKAVLMATIDDKNEIIQLLRSKIDSYEK